MSLEPSIPLCLIFALDRKPIGATTGVPSKSVGFLLEINRWWVCKATNITGGPHCMTVRYVYYMYIYVYWKKRGHVPRSLSRRFPAIPRFSCSHVDHVDHWFFSGRVQEHPIPSVRPIRSPIRKTMVSRDKKTWAAWDERFERTDVRLTPKSPLMECIIPLYIP